MSKIYDDGEIKVRGYSETFLLEIDGYDEQLTFAEATTMCNVILAHINEQIALRAAEAAKQRYEEGQY